MILFIVGFVIGAVSGGAWVKHSVVKKIAAEFVKFEGEGKEFVASFLKKL